MALSNNMTLTDAYDYLTSVLDIEQLKQDFLTNPVNHGLGANLQNYAKDEEVDTGNRFTKYGCPMVHTDTILPPGAFQPSFNQRFGDLVSLNVNNSGFNIYWDVKIASKPIGYRMDKEGNVFYNGKIGKYPTYFTGSITKDSMNAFGGANRFYLTFPITFEHCYLVHASNFSDKVHSMEYIYKKVEDDLIILLNSVPEENIWIKLF